MRYYPEGEEEKEEVETTEEAEVETGEVEEAETPGVEVETAAAVETEETKVVETKPEEVAKTVEAEAKPTATTAVVTTAPPERKVEAKPCFFTVVRTVGGQEYNVALILKARIESKKLDIPSLVVLPRLKGLVFVETSLPFLVQNISYGIKHCKGVLRGKVPVEELLKVIFKPVEVRVGDIVEIVSGPFRGYKGRVIDVDLERESVTIEVLDAASPMPITLRIKDVRVIERKQGETSA